MIEYKTFMQHAKHVTKNAPETRAILKGVQHRLDGSAVVTDSHRLYVVKDIHNREDEVVITPDGEVLSGNYPDTSRLMPDKDYAKLTIQANVRKLLQAVDAVYGVAKLEAETATITFLENTITYRSPLLIAKYIVPIDFETKVTFRGLYWLEALKLFKASGCEEMTLYFHGALRPLVIDSDESNVTALILPVRTY